MENLPFYIAISFVIVTFLTIWIFYKATKKSTATILIILSWIVIQAVIALKGFYTITNTIPPRFLFLIGPPVLFILLLFLFKKGRVYINTLDTKMLTILQSVRIPVELLLLCLFLNNKVPQIMTFKGRNFDILAGITAPIIFYFGYIKNNLGKYFLLTWNLICLGLVINIVILAILSAPFSFQHFGFDQPNIALFYFPFIWLPCCVVPLVLLSHLATISQLLLNRNSLSNQ